MTKFKKKSIFITIFFIIIICILFIEIYYQNNELVHTLKLKGSKSLLDNSIDDDYYSYESTDIIDNSIDDDYYSDESTDTINKLMDDSKDNIENEIDEEVLIKENIDHNIDKLLYKEFDRKLDVHEFINLRNREELHTALWYSVFGKYDQSNNNEDDLMSYKNNIIEKSLYMFNETYVKDSTREQKLLTALHKSLYPWLYGFHYSSLGDIIKLSNGRGIVIGTGDFHFVYARSSIDTIRNVLNCTLPIEVFYCGEDDLSEENRSILKKFKDVDVIDISQYFDRSIVNLKSFAVKPYSILASKFEEVILMDADALYIRNPEELYEDEGYIKTGTLYFQDRSINPGPNPGLTWLKSWMEDPLPETKSLRYYNELTAYEMESSTVLIHKTKNLLGLLAICKLNEEKYRNDVLYKMTYGDKETFWIGFDMARQHYYMHPTPCVFVGKMYVYPEGMLSNKLCGLNGHIVNGKLMYWNGSLIKNKNDKTKSLIFFDSYSITNNNSKWSHDLLCLILNEQQPIYFDEEEKETVKKIIDRENELHIVLPSQ
ncbi:hypothetical protein BCR32DRAFT_295348 [Anaeromyces robustus]|uniref:Nucleotide-diphospho-sugar transferase n=1 Tax=Anaeromyces robustus TaxID=1754192 RepID=A0A1Y1WWE6_9FUNG|nr:hypothetical protein BCR32DRAFT_295348 [Anaeromyces robustus]|eukprot:ORX77881.1 hypothetical protein BCR32DRAFT_295348 [Anaeromyces robustus]